MKTTKFTGKIIYLDLEEMQNLELDDIRNALSLSDNITVIELPIPKPPQSDKDPYRRLKADQSNTEYDYGGTYNLWLYKSKEIFGDWKYVKEAKQSSDWKNPYQVTLDDMKVKGDFKQHSGMLLIKAILFQRGIPKYGFVMEVTRVDK